MIKTLLKLEFEVSIKYKMFFFDLFTPIVMAIIMIAIPNQSAIFGSITPIILLLTIAAFPSLFMAIKTYSEKKYGVFRSLVTTSMTPSHYLISKILYSYITVLLNITIIVSVGLLTNNLILPLEVILIFSAFFVICIPMSTLVGMHATMLSKDFNSTVGISSMMMLVSQAGNIIKGIAPDSLSNWIGFVPIAGFTMWLEDKSSLVPVNEQLYGIVVNPFLNLFVTMLLTVVLFVSYYKNYERYIVKEV